MPDTLRIGLFGPLQVRDGTGHAVHVGGRQLRVLLILLALQAGRVVPAGSLTGELLAGRLGVNPSAQLEQVYLRILRGAEGVPAVATDAVRPSDQTLDAERSVVPASGTTPPPVASSLLTSFVGRDTEVSLSPVPGGVRDRPAGRG